jgi:methylenetetrahydrofolate--tRNA-(uracil-5-)-methyltransferase
MSSPALRPRVRIIGGGLAGSEAAFQLAKRGKSVELYEMRRGGHRTPAHRTPDLGELVCSNSLKSIDPNTSGGLLKKELALLGCFLLDAASRTSVPAGGALAVDRVKFAEKVTETILSLDLVELSSVEVNQILPEIPTIVASGPLTSGGLSRSLGGILGEDNLYFYDAISPILTDESIDRTILFLGSRYGKGGEDYLNCAMNEAEYDRFYDALVSAELTPAREFEEEKYFDACLPVEVIAKRGRDALRFGPLRPVGLSNPAGGRRAHAVVQLRREDREGTMWNMVGFQTRLTQPEQKRVFRTIPGLENARFHRFGSVHRNTFVNTPAALTEFFQPRRDGWKGVLFAGQITGVEGYVESIASGLIAAINLSRIIDGREPELPPGTTMTGALLRYITTADPARFQPMNVNFGLLPHPGSGRGRDKKKRQVERALHDMERWAGEVLG